MSATPIGKPFVELFSRFVIKGLLWHASNESDDYGVVFRRDVRVYRKHPTRFFKGLAIALMAGEIASLLISRMAVPVLYFMANRRGRAAAGVIE